MLLDHNSSLTSIQSNVIKSFIINNIIDYAPVYQVMRCDHGNKVKLPVGNLRPLPSSLTGSLALECALTDIR